MRIALAVSFVVAAAACGKGSSGPSIDTEPGELVSRDHVFRGKLPKGWERQGSADLRAPSGGTELDVRVFSHDGDLTELVAKQREKTHRQVVGVRDGLEQLGKPDLIPKGMGDVRDIDRAGRLGFVVTTRTPGKSGEVSAEPGYDVQIYWRAGDVTARCEIKARGEQAPAYRALIDICLGLEVTKKPDSQPPG